MKSWSITETVILHDEIDDTALSLIVIIHITIRFTFEKCERLLFSDIIRWDFFRENLGTKTCAFKIYFAVSVHVMAI